VSFGESGYCSTESDIHTGRPRCQTGDSGDTIRMTNEESSKVRELKIYDVPFPHAKVQMGCICDNQSIFYNQPLTFQSNSPTLELSFIATKLNNGMAWLVEAKKLDHSLFIQAWGSILPQNPTPEELAKCQTKNRLVIYSGHTMGTIRIICPAIKSESRLSSLKIFSEDWMNSFMLPTK
jgi:hypothetical protein